MTICLDAIHKDMFLGLESLKHSSLSSNQLIALPLDVFDLLPHPLTLRICSTRNRNPDNTLQCDSELCWLKKEELNGNVTWYVFGIWTFEPKCANGIDWDTWNCEEAGKVTQCCTS